MAMTLDQIVDEVRAALAQKLYLRGRTLAGQVRKAGRLLPRHVRKDAGYLVQAQGLAENPKLARQVDMRRAQAAHRSILAHLDTVDLRSARVTMALGIAASIALAVLVTAALLIAVLAWRGFI